MKHFKYGIATLIPFALVIQVLWWVYQFVSNLVISITPLTMEYQWWYVIVFIVGVVIAIYILGLLFHFILPLRWIKTKIEKHIINRLPIVNKVYNFGKDISDSFIADIKDDGELKVVEVMFAGQKSLGVLTDPVHHIIFVPTAPNPLNGFIIQTNDYIIKDMSFIELVQTLASLGRINGSKWTQEVL